MPSIQAHVWLLVFLFAIPAGAQAPRIPLPSNVPGGGPVIYGSDGIIVAAPDGVYLIRPTQPMAPAVTPSPTQTEGLPIDLPVGTQAAGRAAQVTPDQSAGVTCVCQCPPCETNAQSGARARSGSARSGSTPEPFPDVEVLERQDTTPPEEQETVPEPSVPQSDL
ncbi:MAG: hypothetical protein NDJ90_11675 [Oligoflexia bacterium]|nr:hypothetical protein [Oligoflexia bacterium]